MTVPAPVSDAEFTAILKETEGPLIVDYWADDCAACKVVAAWLQQLALDYGERLRIITVDAPHNPAACSAFDVRQVPTLLLMRDGILMHRQVDRLTEEELRRLVEDKLIA